MKGDVLGYGRISVTCFLNEVFVVVRVLMGHVVMILAPGYCYPSICVCLRRGQRTNSNGSGNLSTPPAPPPLPKWGRLIRPETRLANEYQNAATITLFKAIAIVYSGKGGGSKISVFLDQKVDWHVYANTRWS